MDWEEKARPFKTSARLMRHGCLRGIETDRQSGFRTHLPSLAQTMRAKSDAQDTSFSTERASKLHSIQRETTGGDNSDQDGDQATDNNPLKAQITSKQVTKNSRYLREGDRRSILLRIDKGEKQSTLAKEYKVTRAAICYLKKHRNMVLARTNTDPLAKHPKKPRLAAANGQNPVGKHTRSPMSVPPKLPPAALSLPSISALLMPRPPQEPAQQRAKQCPELVREIKTRSMALLLTSVENIITSPAAFQRNIKRMMHLLVEEALASVAVVSLEVLISRDELISGCTIAFPSCAISTMAATCPMLSILSQLEPELPSGYAYVHRNNRSFYANTLSVQLTSSSLPATLKNHNTFVMDLIPTSGHQLCAVIDKLVERGASTDLVTVVSLFTSSDAVAMVHGQFPSVRFLAVQVDPPMDITSAWASRDQQLQKWFARLYDARPSCAPRIKLPFSY